MTLWGEGVLGCDVPLVLTTSSGVLKKGHGTLAMQATNLPKDKYESFIVPGSIPGSKQGQQ